jgi:hypothetical protein
MEQDFSRLIATGRLDEPTLYIPGYINPKRKKTLGFRTCNVRDPNEKNSKYCFSTFLLENNLNFLSEKKKFRVTSFNSCCNSFNPTYITSLAVAISFYLF